MRSSQRTWEPDPPELVAAARLARELPSRLGRDLLEVCDGLRAWVDRKKRLVRAAQEAVDQARLDLNYVRFDLEATRRERDALRSERELDC